MLGVGEHGGTANPAVLGGGAWATSTASREALQRIDEPQPGFTMAPPTAQQVAERPDSNSRAPPRALTACLPTSPA